MTKVTRGNAYQTVQDAYCWRVDSIVGGPIRESRVRSRKIDHTTSYIVTWKPALMFEEHWLLYSQAAAKLGDTNVRAESVRSFGVAFGRPVVEVRFKQTTELATVLENQPEWNDLLSNYSAEQQTPAPQSTAQDAVLNPMQRQGCWPSDTGMHDERSRLSAYLHIHTCPCDPLRDLSEPPLTWCTQTGRLVDTAIRHTDVASVYDPTGRWSGSLSQQRITWLRTCWDRTRALQPDRQDASLLIEGDHEQFAQHVAHFLGRWDLKLDSSHSIYDGLDKHVDRQFPSLTDVISYAHCVVRCSNPLIAPVGCRAFTSPYLSDADFGRLGADFDTVWTGVTWCAPPEKDFDLQHKAIRFAMASAMTAAADIPVLAILLVSRPVRQSVFANSGFDTRWIDDLGALECAGTVRYALVVGNRAGWNLRRDSPANTPPEGPVPRPTYAPRCFRAELARPTPTDHLGMEWSFTHDYVYPCSFKTGVYPVPDATVYTDGSCISTGKTQAVGAAYVFQHDSTTLTVGVHSNGKAETNTINRAELSAIHQALIWAAGRMQAGTTLSLYTDSACSLHVIARVARSGTLPYYHVHSSLLHDIRKALLKLCEMRITVHLRKVKSHTGLPGNDEADRAAKAVALGQVEDLTVCEESAPAAGRNEIFWPVTKVAGGSTTVSDLSQGLRRACSDYVDRNHGGCYNSVYAKAWRNIHHMIDPVCSKVWNHPNISYSMLCTMLKYRFGCLWTTKRASMFGVSYFGSPVNHNDQGEACCPLCGLADSGTHMMGGCTHPTMHQLYISRHNRAVNLIREALAKGSMSGSTMLMDACRRDQLPDGVVGTGTSIGTLLLKAPGVGLGFGRTTKPDLVVMHGVTSDSWRKVLADEGAVFPQGTTLSLFEVGYCQDTKALERREEKHKQHTELASTLQQLGFKVEYPEAHCIMLGHGGTVFNHLHNLLVREGVPHASVKTVVAKLSASAVESAHAILTQRRILEQKKGDVKESAKRKKKEAG